MYEVKDLPGTLQHQRMLHAIVSYYQDDPRILAISVFGSLGRGNWDRYSDIDLDVVIADGTQIEVEAEVRRLCSSFATLDEQIALLIPDEDDADVVFRSLMEMSIRYHPLASTSPNIVNSLVLLWGRIDRSAIEAAGSGNREPGEEPLRLELDRCVRYALEVDSALQRRYLWSAIELLHYLRLGLMRLFARSHHGERTYQFFEKEAGQDLQARLGSTLPQYDLRSAQAALAQSIQILRNGLDALSGAQVQLTEAHLELLDRIEARQKDLKL